MHVPETRTSNHDVSQIWCGKRCSQVFLHHEISAPMDCRCTIGKWVFQWIFGLFQMWHASHFSPARRGAFPWSSRGTTLCRPTSNNTEALVLSNSWLSPVLGRMTIQYCGALPIVNHNSGLGEHRPDPQGPNNWCYHQTRNRGHPQTPSTYQRSLLFGNLFKPLRPKMPWQSVRSET